MMKKSIIPLVGEDVAARLAWIATEHKNVGSFSVSVPSEVLVLLGEKLAELAGRNAL